MGDEYRTSLRERAYVERERRAQGRYNAMNLDPQMVEERSNREVVHQGAQ